MLTFNCIRFRITVSAVTIQRQQDKNRGFRAKVSSIDRTYPQNTDAVLYTRQYVPYSVGVVFKLRRLEPAARFGRG